MNLNSDLIDKTLLENEIRNVKYKYSKRDTLFLNEDNEKIRIKRESSDITNVDENERIFNIDYVSNNLNTGENIRNLTSKISDKEILRFSNKFFKNIINSRYNGTVYGSSYNKFFYYNCTLYTGNQNPGLVNHVTDYAVERQEITTSISDTSNIDFYRQRINNNFNRKGRIYFESRHNYRKTLRPYHYVLSQNKRYFRDYFNDNDTIFAKIDATYPFEPISFKAPSSNVETIGLIGRYKDSFKFNYPSQGVVVPDHVDKNLHNVYSYGAGYRYNKLLNIDKPTFTGWTHAHNGTTITTHSGQTNSHWIVGENQQFMFGSDFEINDDENIKSALLDIRNQDLRFIENWYIFNNNKNNYFGIMANKKILNILNPFTENTRVQKILYNYSNIENKHYNCGRYAKSWGRNENHGSATQPNWVWTYYWDEIDYYSEDKYNYGMHCGYALEKTINESDNLGITLLSKSKLPISIIKKNNNHSFLNTNYKLQKGYSPSDPSSLQNLVIPEDLTIKDNLIY